MLKRSALVALTALLFSTPAFAHVGLHAQGLTAGLAHAFTGVDHLIPMFAIGFWAAAVGGRARIILPATFLVVMMLGARMGLAGLSLPFAEITVMMSVVALAAFALAKLRLNLALSAALAAIFALAHGHLHGAEMPAGVAVGTYFAGFMLTTTALIAAGLGLGAYLTSKTEVPAPRTTP
jgi:urease accessory protein